MQPMPDLCQGEAAAVPSALSPVFSMCWQRRVPAIQLQPRSPDSKTLPAGCWALLLVQKCQLHAGAILGGFYSGWLLGGFHISGTLNQSAQVCPLLSAVQDGERLYYRKTVTSDTILTGRASLRNASNPNSWGVICECKGCKGQAVIKPTKFENCAGNGSAK